MNEKDRKAALPPDSIHLVGRAYPTHHNYEKEIKRCLDLGILRPGEVSMLNIAHDDWCGIYKQARCNCNVQLQDRETGRIINDNKAG